MATIIVLASAIGLAMAAPAAAARPRVDHLRGVETVVAVRMQADFPVRSLMRAICSDVLYVQLRDGRGIETLRCKLSDVPVMIPEFQGVAPTKTFRHRGGPCEWTSDYWFAKAGIIRMASSFYFTVSPSGRVHATAIYPAEPLTCV
jgi:hypothetical protein